MPFHQVVRATTPIFTALIHAVVYRRFYSTATYMSLVIIVVGVGFATLGKFRSTMLGFVLTLLGSSLAAVKTVATNRLQTGPLQLSAFELLYYMSPYAFAQGLAYAYLNGELAIFNRLALTEGQLTASWANVILFNGVIACSLNLVSFVANREVGALTINVAAQLKQIVAIIMSMIFFHLPVEFWNVFGTSCCC